MHPHDFTSTWIQRLHPDAVAEAVRTGSYVSPLGPRPWMEGGSLGRRWRIKNAFIMGETPETAIDRASEGLIHNWHPVLVCPSIDMAFQAAEAIDQEVRKTPMRPRIALDIEAPDPRIEELIEQLRGTHLLLKCQDISLLKPYLDQRPRAVGAIVPAEQVTHIAPGHPGPLLIEVDSTLPNAAWLRARTHPTAIATQDPDCAKALDGRCIPVAFMGLPAPWARPSWPTRPGWVWAYVGTVEDHRTDIVKRMLHARAP